MLARLLHTCKAFTEKDLKKLALVLYKLSNFHGRPLTYCCQPNRTCNETSIKRLPLEKDRGIWPLYNENVRCKTEPSLMNCTISVNIARNTKHWKRNVMPHDIKWTEMSYESRLINDWTVNLSHRFRTIIVSSETDVSRRVIRKTHREQRSQDKAQLITIQPTGDEFHFFQQKKNTKKKIIWLAECSDYIVSWRAICSIIVR